jgi:hypothetical protein
MILNERHKSVHPTYVDHYNRERPHQELGLPTPEQSSPLFTAGGATACRDCLDSLIYEEYRKAM